MSPVVVRWKAKLKIRQGLLAVARARLKRKPKSPSLVAAVNLRKRQVAEAERVIARHSAGSTPHIVTSAQLGLRFQWVFGSVGTLTRTYGHYTGGPRAKTRDDLIATARAVHNQHLRQGWGGCSYGPMIGDDGTLILMNPIGRKAAGVAGHNTGSIHINVPGTTGDRMTQACEDTLRWYVENAHTSRVPKAWRSPVDLRKLNGRVHKDDNATACPGEYTASYRSIL